MIRSWAAGWCAVVLLLGLSACGASDPPIDGQWSGWAADGSYVGYTFGPGGRGERVSHDTVTDFTFAIDGRYDPPRIMLTSKGGQEQGVVRFASYSELRLLLAAPGAAVPISFTPANRGLVLTRREVR